MMIGEPLCPNPTVHVPPWDMYDDYPTANIHSPPFSVAPKNYSSNFHDLPFDNLMAFQRYLTPNNVPEDAFSDNDDLDIPVDTFSCDQFRMYDFKVRKCARSRSHDWTECPYAHPGEKARRRDPRKYHYSGSACPDFRKGECKKGDACEYAHGVFECWLHPARYRTQPCKDGTQCRRRICFFAHTTDQLRILPNPESYDGSPARLGCNSPRLLGLSPMSELYSLPSSPPSDSPPVSPSRTFSSNSGSGLVDSLCNLHIGNRRMTLGSPAWGVHAGSGMCSPRSPLSIRPGFISLPSTPTLNRTRSGLGASDSWDNTLLEEPIMERVESGKDLRARMYAKLIKENTFDSAGQGPVQGPEFMYISELVN